MNESSHYADRIINLFKEKIETKWNEHTKINTIEIKTKKKRTHKDKINGEKKEEKNGLAKVKTKRHTTKIVNPIGTQ